ncbi:MAG: phage/plasmid primase, P4 family [Gammaproteobacteria bacterium]|nr:phage/plasmid primase, P4 family [Gammaproteobacteria bacterium]
MKNSPVDFIGLAAALLAQAEVLVPEWLPGGKRQGREWVCADTNGGRGRSFSVNLESGAFADFASDIKGGDLVALYAAIHGLSQTNAALELADKIGHQTSNYSSRPHSTNGLHANGESPLSPAAEQSPESVALPEPLGMQSRWCYYPATEGGPVLVVCRLRDPEKGKTYRQYTWRDGKWVAKSLGVSRPLYRLRELLSAPNAPVLLVEGEKCADAAIAALPPSWCVTTWSQGSNAVKNTDFSPLYGRAVTIWPDADEPGRKAAAQIAAQLLSHKTQVSVIPTENFPNGWDCADADHDQVAHTIATARTIEREVVSDRLDTPPIEAYADEPGATEIGLSDDELALRFTARYKGKLRYVAAWDRWLIWDGKRWMHDEKRSVFDLARGICREVLTEHLAMPLTDSQRNGLRKRLGDARTIYNVTKLAGSDPHHAVSVKELDADPWMLNTPAGILDLRTGAVSPHDPNALHTKITAAAPCGDCPTFRRVLEEALPSADIREYVRRVFGYGMTGSSRDHALSFWWGGGRNGKGTLAHAFRRALGDYGLEVGAELFMESHHERHPTEIAVLRGARFVVASEIDTGRRWNEARLKRLTGGDPISARYIGKDLFEFEPTHTLLIIGNTKPGLRSVDEAMRARMQLVEFGVTIDASKRDTELPEKLESEFGGILAWAMVGCQAWQKIGLKPPQEVLAATSAYLDAEDSVSEWIEDCCVRSGFVTLSTAHRSYREWCERNAAPSLGRNAFADQLVCHGVLRKERKNGKLDGFDGISVKINAPSMDPSDEYYDRMLRDRDGRYAQ